MTDPRRVVTTYEYDTFGRLVRIKDQQGKVLKQFTYRFATQP
ncbi:MAG: RHS repeat protein [Rudanella sp.]|nr:RHS repeat protein [Rudanella sp.]